MQGVRDACTGGEWEAPAVPGRPDDPDRLDQLAQPDHLVLAGELVTREDEGLLGRDQGESGVVGWTNPDKTGQGADEFLMVDLDAWRPCPAISGHIRP